MWRPDAYPAEHDSALLGCLLGDAQSATASTNVQGVRSLRQALRPGQPSQGETLLRRVPRHLFVGPEVDAENSSDCAERPACAEIPRRQREHRSPRRLRGVRHVGAPDRGRAPRLSRAAARPLALPPLSHSLGQTRAEGGHVSRAHLKWSTLNAAEKA